jgi:uncharacterized damage-inducible protein DinB
MKTQTEVLLALWKEARTRLEDKLVDVTQEDLANKLLPFPNSIGFLIRHVAEVELLFAKNIYGAKDTKITAKTVIAQRDTGEWIDLKELMEILDRAKSTLKGTIKLQTEKDWDTTIETTEFGIRTKVQTLGRIISHTAYHTGQIGVLLKYGESA